MAIVKCKECGKEVAHDAKVCPHCGKKNPGIRAKDYIIGLLILVVIGFVVASCVGDEQSSKRVADGAETSILKSDIAVENARKCVIDINNALMTIGIDGNARISSAQKTAKGDGMATIRFGNGDIATVTCIADENGYKGMVFTGAGDGTAQSGAKIITYAVASIMALTNPRMSKDERTRLLAMMRIGDLTENNEPVRFEYGGYRFKESLGRYTGYSLTAERIE